MCREPQGSAVLGEAIGAIHDWSASTGKESRSTRETAFGSLVFSDEDSIGKDTATATTAPGAGPLAAKPDRLVVVVGPGMISHSAIVARHSEYLRYHSPGLCRPLWAFVWW